MTYERGDLAIVMTCGQAVWHWALTDADGDCIENGRRPDFRDASNDALKAFDRALKGDS